MHQVDVGPFTDDDLEEAGALLARRHAAHRVAVPLLARRFEAVDAATSQLAALWKMPGASGAVARSAGRAVGYLLGTPRSGDVWGANVWVPAAGHAVEQPETVRDLYGVAATRWVEQGRTVHYAVVPASDKALVDAWFRLGFGQQHVLALRRAERSPAVLSDGVEIRRASGADVAALAALDLLLPAHQRLSPVFSASPVPTLAEALAECGNDLDDPATGYRIAVTDWRATNLLSSRAWPGLGFGPSFLRLHRVVGY